MRMRNRLHPQHDPLAISEEDIRQRRIQDENDKRISQTLRQQEWRRQQPDTQENPHHTVLGRLLWEQNRLQKAHVNGECDIDELNAIDMAIVHWQVHLAQAAQAQATFTAQGRALISRMLEECLPGCQAAKIIRGA